MKSGLTVAHLNIYILLHSRDIVLFMCRIVSVQLDYDGEKCAKCLILLIDPGSSVKHYCDDVSTTIIFHL